MTTGKRLAGLLLLTSALTFPGVAFAQGTGSTTGSTGADGGTPIDQDPVTQEGEPDGQEPDISIPGGNEIVVTGRYNRDVTRSSTQVVSILTTEEIARTGEGDIAGALGRVTGLSVQGNGFVYVRGLGDRYSLALLNGLPLPSPQPLSRVVPLDIFPTSIVASSLVQKSYSANFPGEFGGGVINLTTRAIPEDSFVKIGGGISGDTQTTGYEGYSFYGSDLDPFGFDDGTRDVPPTLQAFFDSGERINSLNVDQQAILKELGNPNLVLTQKIGNLPVNWSTNISGGTAFDVFSDGRFGILASASISNKWRNRVVTSQAVDASFNLNTDFTDFITDNRILVNGLLGFGLEVGEHKFRFTNVFIRDSQKQARLSTGEDLEDGDSEFRQDTAWFERQLFDTQLVGELEFGELGVDVRAGYAQTQREAPYEYSFTYVRTNNPNDPFGDLYLNLLNRQRGDARVAFSELTEDLYYGGVDLSYPVTDWAAVTVGYAYTDTDRISTRREFIIDADADFDTAVGAFRPDYLLGDAVIDFYNLGLIETTQSDPSFRAQLEIHGAYGKVLLTPISGVTLDLGVRYEDAVQSVDPVQVFTVPIGSNSSSLLENDYFLPAATLTWEATDDLQVRVSGSKTIARPQFRELIFQTYYDPETNRQFNGNPLLVDSELVNAEARAEYYFGGGARVAAAGFYKKIDNPIEIYSAFSDNEQVASFANAPEATLYGFELDGQYTFDLYDLDGEFWATKEFVVVGNYTFTQSEIKVGANDTTLVFPGGEQPATALFVDGVPLTGQSDHLLNAQFSLQDTDRLQQATILVSYASERVTSRGTSGLPDIVERPGVGLDFVYRQGFDLFDREVELKFEARNLLGTDHQEFQTNGTDRIEVNSYEVGTSFSLSASVTF